MDYAHSVSTNRFIKWAAEKVVALESQAFDVLHSVDTRAPKGKPLAAVENSSQNFEYLPTRPNTIRKLLKSLPISDFSTYTFVDFGSGKGRVLLLAAELPFASVQGVELSPELHSRAIHNIGSARGLRRRAGSIESTIQNAADYEFPDSDLVLFFANPFGPAVMRTVLDRAIASWKARPRDILLIFYFLEYDPNDRELGIETIETADRYRICRIERRVDLSD